MATELDYVEAPTAKQAGALERRGSYIEVEQIGPEGYKSSEKSHFDIVERIYSAYVESLKCE